MNLKPFLTATWSNLAMLNYEVDPEVVRPYLPLGTELDAFDGRHYVSMVGFLYSNTKVLGIGVPGYRQFAEVNLRFYVRHQAADGWRRGVVFIKEIVPRRAVAYVARKWYDEPFQHYPMRYTIDSAAKGITASRVQYSWKHKEEWNRIELTTGGFTAFPDPGSEEEFVTEHYWGYTARRDGGTSEYRVDHPKWRVTPAASASFECDVAAMYGERFVEPLGGEPSSAFLAEGSPIVVYHGARLDHSYVQRYAVSSATLT